MQSPAAILAREAVAARARPGPPVSADARVALHFHPDVDARGDQVLWRILRDGSYRSQFVTGTSNGGLTAVPQGDRWRWEHRIFDGAYDDAEPIDRPVYGALDLDHDPYGPAPRFGSAYLRLREAVLVRTTFAYPDSVSEPAAFGTADRFGLTGLWREETSLDPLDHYVEAHVHGEVRVPEDVEALVLDPSFRTSGLAEAARSAGLAVEWHPGYRLTIDGPIGHDDYRGPDVVVAVGRWAAAGVLTPADLGARRASPDLDPQLVKRVWHYLARYGRRSDAQSSGSSRIQP